MLFVYGMLCVQFLPRHKFSKSNRDIQVDSLLMAKFCYIYVTLKYKDFFSDTQFFFETLLS